LGYRRKDVPARARTQDFCASRRLRARLFLVSRKAPLLFPAENQRFRFRVAISKWLAHIRHEIDRAIENRIKSGAKITDREVATLVASTVSKHHELLQKRPNLARFDHPNAAAALQRVYGKEIAGSIAEILENLPIGRSERKLRQCCGFVGVKDAYWLEESGIVFAGFGEKEIFPSVQSFRVDAVVDNKLRFVLVPDRSEGITFETSSLVIAFAQSEMVSQFMNGIDSSYRNHILRFTNLVLSDRYPDIVKTAVARAVSDADAVALSENMKHVGKQLIEILTKAMRDYELEKHSNPIVEIVQHLPKEELAVMAESLVNLTSLKRHITRDAETVGGPIDVAVISRGDGFIWIKRKHYFNRELNPHFLATYYEGG